MLGALTLVLAAIGIGVAWLVFRIEHLAARRSEITGARDILLAVKRGMIDGIAEQGLVGWGEIYFSTVYDEKVGARRAGQTRKLVEQRGWEQVFVVPTEPLELLATTTTFGDLISEETIFAANFALWRVRVFNQLVEKTSAFNVQHAAEILDPATTDDRLTTLGIAAANLSQSLHVDGIGTASAPGGWYDRLKEAVAADAFRLGELATSPWWSYRVQHRLMFGDAAAILLCAGFLALGIVQGTTGDGSVTDRTKPNPASLRRAGPARGWMEHLGMPETSGMFPEWVRGSRVTRDADDYLRSASARLRANRLPYRSVDGGLGFC